MISLSVYPEKHTNLAFISEQALTHIKLYINIVIVVVAKRREQIEYGTAK